MAIELFTELSEEVKNEIKNYINLVLKNFPLLSAAKIICEFAEGCVNEDEQNFIDFYFNLKLEEMRKEYV